MRIITGRARGTRLYTLEGESTRPTSERTKEAVFSMIQFFIQGSRVLDLFAGSGQMALEALSRGASYAVACDSNPEACKVIRRNAEKTHFQESLTLYCEDCTVALRSLANREKFDLVFLDPPYNKGLVAATLGLLCRYGLLNESAVIVCESGGEDIFDGVEKKDFSTFRSTGYGIAKIDILKYKDITNQ